MVRTQSDPATGLGGTRRVVLLAVLPVLVLLAALAPASAMAGAQGGGSSANCTAEVEVTDDETVSDVAVECGDLVIENVGLTLNEQNEGRVEGVSATTCDPDETSLNFDCQPSGGSEGTAISARFTDDDGESSCATPALEIDFSITFEDPEQSPEEINDVAISGCPSASAGDEDSGATPEGGVDSGTGVTANRASPGPALPIAGALVVLVLASAGVFVRRTRANS